MYGTVSSGTRPGGFNRTVPRSEDPAQSVGYACNNDLNALGVTGSTDSFDGDEVVNYELGWKADLTENVRLNAAVYLMQWDDIQQKITLSGDCGVDLTTNVGDAESQGAELDSGNVKPDYDIINLRFGYSSEDNWELLLYVDNVTDEEAIFSYSDALAFNIPPYDRTVRSRPRTIGTSFTYNF